MNIPKYRGQNLACWCLHLWLHWMAFICCCALSWLLIWLQSEVMDPCFIHCHIFMQTFFFVALKQCSELSMHCCFWLTVSKYSTHFEHSFLIDKCSCKMVNTLLSDIFNSSAISCNFNLWLAKVSLWSFLVFSGITAEFGWPEHSVSFVFVWLRLKSAYHLLTIVSDRAELE